LRFCFGMSGLTRSHSSLDTVHDLIALMTQSIMDVSHIARYYLRINTKIIFFTEKPKPSVRRGRKAADLISKRKMAELPMDDFWQARPFCFDSSIKGKGGEKGRTK
jgi:hypothetical protein